MAGDRPNILWFCSDQQRWDTVGALGNEHVRTPALDALYENGVAFARAYVQNTLCTPSRASFMTGRYPAAHRVFRNGDSSFPPGEVPVSRLFAEAGYHCGLVGKLHLAEPVGGTEARGNDGYASWRWSFTPRPEDGTSAHNAYHHWLRGKGVDAADLFADVDAFLGPGVPAALHQTTWVAEEAVEFIHAHRGGPWLLSVNPFAPHHPFDPAPEYMERYDAESLPHPLFRESDLARQATFAKIQHNTVEAIDPTVRHETDGRPVRFDGRWENCFTVGHYYGRDVKAAYYAMIEHLDWALGQLVAALEETGQRENTIVLYTSDHGELLGDHGLIFKGCRFFEGAVRVPLLIAWPAGFARGLVSEALVEEVDIAPTLLEAAGLDVPRYMQGVSLVPILRGEADPGAHKEWVICHFNRSDDYLVGTVTERTHATMTFDGRHKLVVYHGHDLCELFDLDADPGEFDNLWDETGNERRETLMRAHLEAVAATLSHGREPYTGLATGV